MSQGDNRYELFVNGARVSWGPARGDLTHWRYETVDIGAQLRGGKTYWRPSSGMKASIGLLRRFQNRTGFVLEADRAEDIAVNTGKSWRCIEDKSYSPQPLPHDQATGYYALGANEKVDAKLYPWSWSQPEYDDSNWLAAREITHAAARDARDAPNRWMLVAREIPLEEQSAESDLKIERWKD